ncbi:MAG: signal peptidase I [Gammaproteobacteria bacterium]
MDVDFPLLLTWAVLITGAVWLVDIVLFRPRRRRAAEAYRTSHPGRGQDDEAVMQILKEPVLAEYARSFFPVLLLVLVLRSFLVEPYQIPSESMVPTLQVGDFILVNKYAYGIRLPVIGTKLIGVGQPQRGDVMVFIPPHEQRYFIKRVVGLAGDHVRYHDKVLSINGQTVPQRFIEEVRSDGQPSFQIYDETLGTHEHLIYRYRQRVERPQEWVVPVGHYFMMGDNRDRSDDSRRWGFVSDTNVIGKAVAVWVHKDPGLHWPTFGRNGLID